MAKLNLEKISINTLLEMSQDELLALAKRGLDKSSLSREEYATQHRNQLAQITSRVVSVANKRIKSLSQSKIGRTSPAYVRAKEMSPSGKFSVRGKDWNQILNTLKEAKQWLSYKTSTAKGWEEVRKNIESDIGGGLDTTYKSRKFWEAYRRISEVNGGIMGRKGSKSRLSSDRIQKLLYQTITGKDGKVKIDWRTKVDTIVSEANKLVDREYKIEQRKSSDMGASNYVLDEFDEDDED